MVNTILNRRTRYQGYNIIHNAANEKSNINHDNIFITRF